MAGIISRIGTIINGSLPTNSSADVRVMGTAIPIDPYLVGRTRFAKKIGDTMAILVSNNSTTTSTPIAINSNQLVLAEIVSPYIIIGSKLLVNDVELVTVDDIVEVNTIANTMTIRIAETFKVFYASNTKVVLFGHPLQINTDPTTFTELSTFIVENSIVPSSSPYTVQLGHSNITEVTVTGILQPTYTSVSSTPSTGQVQVDVTNGILTFNAAQATDTVRVTYRYVTATYVSLSITSNSISTSSGYVRIPIYATDSISVGYTSYKIKKVISSLPVTDASGSIVSIEYQLLFEPSLLTVFNKIIHGGDTVHLRAFPAYESKVLQIPHFPFTQHNLGPFCLDWLSGVTTENTIVNEIMTINLYDQGTTDVNGNLIPVISQTIDKNFLVLREPIQADSILYWDLLRGKINWDGTNVLAFVDGDDTLPTFSIHYKTVPTFLPGQFTNYLLHVTNPNTNATKITVIMDPAGPTDFIVLGNTSTTLTIPITANVERIYLSAIPLMGDNVTPGSTLLKPLLFGDWAVDNTPITSIQYTLVVNTDVRYRWGSTGMFVKPIMLSNDYLQSRLDVGGGVDNGKLAL